MKIEILGMGCQKCRILYENTLSAVKELGVDAEVVKVEDLSKVIEYAVMITPALVINGTVRSMGKVLDKEEIISLIKGFK